MLLLLALKFQVVKRARSLAEYLDTPYRHYYYPQRRCYSQRVILSVMLKVKAILIDDILNTGLIPSLKLLKSLNVEGA